MSISNIQNPLRASIPTTHSNKNTKEENNKIDIKNKEAPKDVSVIYTSSQSLDKKEVSAKNTYKPNMAEINKIKEDLDNKTGALRSLVEKMILKQGYTVKDVLKASEEGNEINISIDSETQKQAQLEISEDGYWGVKQTSERIVEFAKQLSGGDPAKAKEMRDAFVEGFKSAKEAFGGELPEISYQTYDAVMKGFDEWEGISQSSGTEEI